MLAAEKSVPCSTMDIKLLTTGPAYDLDYGMMESKFQASYRFDEFQLNITFLLLVYY